MLNDIPRRIRRCNILTASSHRPSNTTLHSTSETIKRVMVPFSDLPPQTPTLPAPPRTISHPAVIDAFPEHPPYAIYISLGHGAHTNTIKFGKSLDIERTFSVIATMSITTKPYHVTEYIIPSEHVNNVIYNLHLICRNNGGDVVHPQRPSVSHPSSHPIPKTFLVPTLTRSSHRITVPSNGRSITMSPSCPLSLMAVRRHTDTVPHVRPISEYELNWFHFDNTSRYVSAINEMLSYIETVVKRYGDNAKECESDTIDDDTTVIST